MAKSPAHRVGQIIGYALEQSVRPQLERVAAEHDLYLDASGPRDARGGRKLLTWVDHAGNKHNLDFVLERGGSDHGVGAPAAFIEVAWRRYTKHSVNKAGEIANALVPLRQTYSRTRPFTGAVIAGEWTEPGIQHLASQGIAVLYVPFGEIVAAFAKYGIDMNLGEATPLDYLDEQIAKWDALGLSGQIALALTLVQQKPERYALFRSKIDAHLQRRVVSVRVLPLHGTALAFENPFDAISALRDYPVSGGTEEPLDRIEVQLEFSNGDGITADFRLASDAIAFLDIQA